MSEFDDVLVRLRTDDLVLGVVLRGSQARGAAGPHSNHDVLVVVADEAADTRAELRRRDDRLNVQVMSLAEFAETPGRARRPGAQGHRDVPGGRPGERQGNPGRVGGAAAGPARAGWLPQRRVPLCQE